MQPHIVRGSKQEIAETVVGITGDVREAIVFVEEPAKTTAQAPGQDIFLEMEPFTVRAGGADYSCEALYSPAYPE